MRISVATLILLLYSLSAQAITLRDACESALVVLKPRLGLASGNYEGFDLRVAADYSKPSQWSAALLERAAAANLSSARARLVKADFRLPKHIHILLERNAGTITSELTDLRTCMTFVPDAKLSIKGFLNKRVPFAGDRLRVLTSPSVPTLVLKVSPSGVPTALSKFVLAHELAHTTEPHHTCISAVWREARADFLAYYLTGVSDPSPYIFTGAPRSLFKPSIARLAQTNLDSAEYHLNSQIISHFLFRFSNRFGLEHALNFIRWFDGQDDYIIHDLASWSPDSFNERIEGPEVREELEVLLDNFFEAFDIWAARQERLQIDHWLKQEKLRIGIR